MIRADLASLFQTAATSLASGRTDLPQLDILEPRDPSHGDFACNFALAASKLLGKPPRQIAEELVAALPENDFIASTEIAGPGFINIRLVPGVAGRYVAQVLNLGTSFVSAECGVVSADSPNSPPSPTSPISSKSRINLEFVSVNPNGPITVGSGRGAAYGSTLGNVLEAAGYEVHREYYINDGVNSEQMRLFAESVRALVLGNPVPEGGYKGDYVYQIADEFKIWGRHQLNNYLGSRTINLDPDSFSRSKKERIKQITSVLFAWKGGPEWTQEQVSIEAKRQASTLTPEIIQICGQELMTVRQRVELIAFAVSFDTWFSEQSLHDSGAVDQCVQDLIEKGAADEEPIRRKLKLVKGGVIEDVLEEAQGEGDETGELGEVGDLGDKDEPIYNPQSTIQNVDNPQSTTHNKNTLWLRSTKFGDDMDRVLRRKDGRLTYIASDVAYHKDKFNRGSKPKPDGTTEPADKLITILGPDHHGYIGRLHAVVGALLESTEPLPYSRNENEGGVGEGVQPFSELEQKLYRSAAERDACQTALAEARERLEVVIFQIVRFVKNGLPAPMRKRDGNIYSLRDLMSEIGKTAAPNEPEEEQMRIGKDVARFFYLMRSHDTHMDFDIDLATKQSDENPVFYCQYAHARICSILERASNSPSPFRERGQGGEGGNAQLNLLTHERELALIKKICDLPDEVMRCAEDYGVHRLTTYAQELAKSFHYFYDGCRVIQADMPELTQARLSLCEATKIGLKTVFDLLGISAPTRMERSVATES